MGAAAFLPSTLLASKLPEEREPNSRAGIDYHLHPHYREQIPLDTALLKRSAGLDEFVNEKYHDQIAAILTEWSRSLRHSPRTTQPIEKALTTDFSGPSLRPLEVKLLRPGTKLEVRQLRFSTELTHDAETFPDELRQYLSNVSQILTADFQVTAIDAGSEGELRTQVLYELVSAGNGFHRE